MNGPDPSHIASEFAAAVAEDREPSCAEVGHSYVEVPGSPVGWACEVCGESPPDGWYPEADVDTYLDEDELNDEPEPHVDPQTGWEER